MKTLARRPKLEVEAERAQQSLLDVVKPSKKKRKRPPPSRQQRGEWADEANELRRAGLLAKAKPKHFVGLYILFHRHVYGVDPLDVRGKQSLVACGNVERMLAEEFDGNAIDMVRYIRWAWKRENEREKWRRSKGRDGKRLSWRHLFVFSELLTDYRVARSRTK